MRSRIHLLFGSCKKCYGIGMVDMDGRLFRFHYLQYGIVSQGNTNSALGDGLSRMLIIRFDIEHLTGKEAIELVKQKNPKA